MAQISDAKLRTMLAMSQLVCQVLVALAVLFAAFFHGGNTQLFQTGAISCLIVGAVLVLVRALEQRRMPWSKLHIALLVYLGLLTLNFFTSVFPENTRFAMWAFLSMPFVVLILGPSKSNTWTRLLVLLSLPLVASASWGIAEFIQLGGRASGPGSDPNSWASSMNLAFYLFVGTYWVVPRRWVPLLLGLLALLATASFMSYSRVGIVVFFAALLTVVALAARHRSYRGRALVLLVLCISSYVGVQSFRSIESATRNQEGYTLNAEAYGWTVRFAQWDSALRQYLDYPVTGSGLGTFKVLYPQYRTLADATTAGNYVHNDYLQLLAECGPGVLLAVILFVGLLLVQLFLSIKRLLFDHDASRRKELELISLLVGIGTVFVHGIMNFTLFMLLNQLLIGCALVRVMFLLGWLSPRQLPIKGTLAPQFVVILFAVNVLATTYADTISHDLVYKGGVLPLDRHDPNDQLLVFEILSHIRTFRGDSSTNRFAMATFYRTSFDAQPLENEDGRRSLAIATALEYEQGLVLNPFASDVRGYYSNFLEQNPWLMEMPEVQQTPESLLREGLGLTPIRIEAYVKLADYLERTGRSDEAYAVLKSGLPWAPLMYENYRYWRDQLKSRLVSQAQRRGDDATLQGVLDSF